ncbi:MAG: DUF721 domain-containing protein [Lentisphaeria bacterium]|nr:DUF721 domain-containing protein [Lentisphaeria bacterium]
MSDTYRLSYARKKELFERRKRFGLLSDWYGEDFARTEIAAHTSKVHSIGADIDELLGEVVNKENQAYVDLAANWKTVGGAMAQLATPGGLRDGVLYLEVRHSALLRELHNISEIILPKLAERYGDGVFKEIKLVCGGRANYSRR